MLGKFSLLGFLGSCFYYLCLYWGYHVGEGIQVLVLQYTWPLFIVLLSILILREKLTKGRIVSCILGFLGVLVILTKGNLLSFKFPDMMITLVVLIGALSFALFSVLSKKITANAFHSVFYYFLSGTLFSLVSLFIFSEPKLPINSNLTTLIINGALINGLSYLLWIKALRLTESSRIAPLVFLAPVLSAIWLVLFFNEVFLPIYALGITLTIVSGLLAR